jgi:hypothetical protein
MTDALGPRMDGDEPLASRWRAPGAVGALRDAWRTTGSIRIEGLLEPAVAEASLDALRVLPHEVALPDQPDLGFLTWKMSLIPEPTCEHVLCRLGRWLHGPGVAWVSSITGLELAPPPDGRVSAFAYVKGSYLDDHNDWGRDRAVAYVLGLTPPGPDAGPPWPQDRGGWLEFTGGRLGPVVEARPPGWNTLDLFDVRGPDRWHRIPLVQDHVERRTLAGWFYRPS